MKSFTTAIPGHESAQVKYDTPSDIVCWKMSLLSPLEPRSQAFEAVTYVQVALILANESK